MARQLVLLLSVLLFDVGIVLAKCASANESPAAPRRDASLLVEAESFQSYGGWGLDTQFIRNMGSPYLIAHGLGKPVEDAVTTIELPATGTYHVYARTKDWVARWKAPGSPGRFQIHVNGKPLPNDLGTEGSEWHWQKAGSVDIATTRVELRLKDLMGFDGRCDAIYFSQSDTPPSNSNDILPAWRKEMLGLPAQTEQKGGYDLVVIGGGYAGMGAAISAARMGCKVALIQDRPVLGGNGSSEIRVWAMGLIRRGKYPRIGEIVEEFSDKAKKSPGTFEEFEDAKKEALVRAEKNIDLFLEHHAHQVKMDGKRIESVTAFEVRTSREREFRGKLFVDATGHGTLGALAGADWNLEEKGRMGMSNMWAWDEATAPTQFPKTPWALPLEMKDFPYPVDHHGQWFWESGFDKDPLGDAEAIRDWNLRAVFGAFNAMKNGDGATKHPTAVLTWVAYIGGPRESRQLYGDVILTQDDVVSKKEFPDGCVPSTWSIDLHYPKKQFAQKFPDNPFISIAEHDRRIDRNYGYPIPYRCFYSRNIENMFMAGRCISVTHEALGTVRVMKTCGMMGEVVGKAASICVQNDCLPYAVYERYWKQMDELLQLPGKAFRQNVNAPLTIPADSLPLASEFGPMTGIDPATLPGVVLDNRQAKTTGKWTSGEGLKGYFAHDYVYAGSDSGASIRYEWTADRDGEFLVRIAYQPHENRGSRVPVLIETPAKSETVRVDMRKPPREDGWVEVGQVRLRAGETLAVTLSTEQSGGFVHADALQILPTP
ncbi:dihydrolipoamide dehydrogenase [Pirellula sp. SH-Sr6A]|uniref:FAD-dependent oxidoreductase n=1 Tax=Pirellula sp. SH-Sr6A TaxID=1632865 RepID=UPI00078E40DF|nr:FAD-dependent oxidoreductase [Pirellula sp. SH-Sr6A]AMV34237.1 dihydrolipoamide dehydrogenase [Pirellula sp. SH-Sr6A]